MNKISGTVLAALAVLLALYVAYCSGNRDGARTALANQRDAILDSVARAGKQQTTRDSIRLERARDSTGRVIRDLQKRVTSGGARQHPGLLQNGPAVTGMSGPAGKPASSGGPTDVRDSLIAALTAGRQQDSLQLLFWKAQVAQRDSLLDAVRASRDAWRKRSERRISCGAGAAVTVGLDGRAAVGPSVGCFIRL